MVLMRKGNTAEYVPDAFVDDYRKRGYKVDAEDDAACYSTNSNGRDNSEDAEVADKFVCPHCGKEYTKQASLDKHIAEKHAG